MRLKLKKILIVGGVLVLSGSGLFAWRGGLMPQISRFFAAEPNGNVRYFGYYWAGADPFVPNIYYLSEVAPDTNFVELNLWEPDLLGRAAEMKRKGMRVIIPLSGCFFEPSGGRWRLKPNWLDSWNACKQQIAQVQQQVNVFAFYVMDEPIGNGLTMEELETGTYYTKTSYPGVKVYINESEVGPTGVPIARYVDAYSLTCFSSIAVCQANYEILKQSFSGEIWVVGFAYSGSTSVEHIQQTWDWVRSDSRFSGMYWFLYADANGQCGIVPGALCGARHYPVIKARISLLGKDVLCHNTWDAIPVCGTNGVTYSNPDKAKCAGTTIATYGQCATCPATPPTTPSISQVTSTSATISWTPGTGGNFQQLRVGKNLNDVMSGCSGGTCLVKIDNLPSTTSSYAITGMTPNAVYHWRVVNFNTANTCFRDLVSQVTTLCPATPPSNLSASQVTDGSATISWTPGTGGSFQQLRVGKNRSDVMSGCSGGTCLVKIDNLSSATNSHVITGMTPNTVYHWRVVNFNTPYTCFRDALSRVGERRLWGR